MELEGRIAALAGDNSDRAARLRRAVAAAGSPGWQLLTAHRTVDGRRLDTPNVHTLYLHLTDRLIHRVTDERFDRVVFLDKSARPVAWLLLALWDQLAVRFDEVGVAERFRRPAVTFLNIDRLQWRELLDPQGVGALEFELLPVSVPAGLRRCLLRDNTHSDFDEAALWECPTLLDGERVLVVDEVSVSGDTAHMAAQFVRLAVPEAHVHAGHWMQPRLVTGSDGNRRNNLLPVWYRDDTVLGRGVGDRDDAASSASPRWRVRAGARFLSRPHPPGFVDRPARQLRAEVRRLAGDLLVGQAVLVPEFDREDAEARCRWFNGMDLRDLAQWRERNEVVIAP